nr:Chain B, Envelope small membrane protein [Betacoronavirus England 1]
TDDSKPPLPPDEWV